MVDRLKSVDADRALASSSLEDKSTTQPGNSGM
jgi:hypothetical protein